MAKEDRPSRLAVLIDADNTSATIADGLFEEIAKIGEASVRRIYGDIASTRSKSWSGLQSRHALIWQQQTPHTTGKNASDITLVIDAMDLLHSGRFDGFCLVSSDSDFTRLASRIREEGVDVFGFGQQKTPESFRQACRRFIYTENLLPKPPVADVTQDAKPLEPVANAVKVLRRIIQDIDSDDGWVLLGTIGNQLANLAPDFDPRTYGYKKLSDLVRAVPTFEIGATSGNALRLRLRPKASTAKKAGPKAPKG
jgi:Fe-S-cluster formation regulator IscX/YfhJ